MSREYIYHCDVCGVDLENEENGFISGYEDFKKATIKNGYYCKPCFLEFLAETYLNLTMGAILPEHEGMAEPVVKAPMVNIDLQDKFAWLRNEEPNRKTVRRGMK